jgi:hypothetical protein
MTQAQSLFGLPNVGDLLGGLKNLPGVSEIDALKHDFDDFANSINTVVGYAEKYGDWIPGAKAALGPLELLNKSLQLVKHLIDAVP